MTRGDRGPTPPNDDRRPSGDRTPPGATPVQDSWPELTCFGCGPANPAGIRLKSHLAADGSALVAVVRPDARFTSGAPNVAYGGYLASLADCHSIWTAIAFAYRAEGRPLGSEPRIAYVTAELDVRYRHPTPLDRPIRLRAWVEGEADRETRVRCELGPESEVTATAEVLAMRVNPEAFAHR